MLSERKPEEIVVLTPRSVVYHVGDMAPVSRRDSLLPRLLPLSRTAIVFGAVLLVAIAARALHLWITLDAPGFAWIDSDHYLSGQAASLVRNGHWQWTWDAVDYVWHGRHWVLSPLYPVFLSLIGAVSNPMAGAIGHIALSVAAVGSLFVAGRSLHSIRAGLVAAGLAAVWLAEIGGTPHFMQERLFVPLVVASFAWLLHATSTEAAPTRFAVAGGLFALTALTRPTALYYVPISVAIVVFGPGGPPRRVAIRQGVALLAGWLAVVGPYIAAVSAAKGELVLVDNRGAIEYFQHDAFSPLTEMLAQLTTTPAEYLREKAAVARALLHLNGGRWAQLYGTAWTPEGALGWKLAAHAFIDVPLLLVLALAPFGVALARARREVWLLGAWIAVSVILTVLANYGGARYRSPIEFPLILLASIPLAHGLPKRVVSIPRLTAAMAMSVSLLALLLAQVPASLSAKTQSGVTGREAHTPPMDRHRIASGRNQRVGF